MLNNALIQLWGVPPNRHTPPPHTPRNCAWEKPTGKNPSIVPDTPIDRPVAPKFQRNGICAKISMENSHPLHLMSSHHDAPKSPENRNILLTFSASWTIFQPLKNAFHGPFYNLFKISQLFGLFDAFPDLSSSICAECVPKFPAQSSISVMDTVVTTDHF